MNREEKEYLERMFANLRELAAEYGVPDDLCFKNKTGLDDDRWQAVISKLQAKIDKAWPARTIKISTDKFDEKQMSLLQVVVNYSMSDVR